MNNIKKPRLKKNLDKGYLNEIKGSDIICDLSFSDEKSLNDIKDIEFNGCLFKNIDFSEREIKIMGKGSKERFVFYNKECAIVLDSYLKECRSKLLNGKDSEYLFINHLGDKLTDRGIRLIIDKIVKKSCIKSKVSPHTFRHTFATMLLNEGCNIKSVQELLGHSSLGTTGIYTHLTNDEVRLAYMKAHPRA